MKLLITTDAHIFKTSNGEYWCGAIYGYKFWLRYLDVFDSIRIVARVKNVTKNDMKLEIFDGPNVEIFEIPFFQGITQLTKNYLKINRIIKNVFIGCDAALFRMPSPIGQIIWNYRNLFQGPTALEVVYDLSNDLNDSGSSFIDKAISFIQAILLKSACKKANGVSYVTENAIQRNFPCTASINGETQEYFNSWYSTITLNDDAFGKVRDFTDNKSYSLVISDVAMNSYRKGEKIFLNVISKLREKNYDVRGIIIGDGSKRLEFEELSCKLGLSEFVLFTGLLSSTYEVRKYLNLADIYFFPTAAEGLPRGLLEAMAVGLPIVSTPVGGIPEVIEEKYLANQSDIELFVEILEMLINNPHKMNELSNINIEIARKFGNEVLQLRRNVFYNKLLELCVSN